MDVFETLRKRIDLAELAGRYTDLQPSGRALVGRCPHPEHDDEHPSFYVYDDGRFFCYGCRWRGDVTDLHAGVTGLRPGMQAALDLAREFGVELPKMSNQTREKIERRRQLESKYLKQAQEHHEALSRHPGVVEWWEGRAFDEGLRDRFLLGASDNGPAATIPFWHGGRVHGLVRRKLRGDPKYVLPEKEDLVLGHRPLFIPGRVTGGRS